MLELKTSLSCWSGEAIQPWSVSAWTEQRVAASWRLIFTLWQDGCSLNTLLEVMEEVSEVGTLNHPLGTLSPLWKTRPEWYGLTSTHTTDVIILLLLTVICYKSKLQWKEGQTAADWRWPTPTDDERHTSHFLVCFLTWTCSNAAAAHSHGSRWDMKHSVGQTCSGVLRKAGEILFWLQTMDRALGCKPRILSWGFSRCIILDFSVSKWV